MPAPRKALRKSECLRCTNPILVGQLIMVDIETRQHAHKDCIPRAHAKDEPRRPFRERRAPGGW